MKTFVAGLMLLVSMGTFAVDATAYGQIFLSRVACADMSTPEACARNMNVSVGILPGLETPRGARIKTYILAEFGQQRWVLSGETSPPSWVEYRGGFIPHYSTEVVSEEPIWINFGEMNLSDFFGLRLAVGYGHEPEGPESHYPCGSAFSCMVYHNSWEWVWELTQWVNVSKVLLVKVRQGDAGGGVVVSNTAKFVPMGQTWEIGVTPPTPPEGYKIKTTIKMNDVVAHVQCRPDAMWYGEVARRCYFSSYRTEADRLEIQFQLEQIVLPSQDNNDSDSEGGDPPAPPPPPPPGGPG